MSNQNRTDHPAQDIIHQSSTNQQEYRKQARDLMQDNIQIVTTRGSKSTVAGRDVIQHSSPHVLSNNRISIAILTIVILACGVSAILVAINREGIQIHIGENQPQQEQISPSRGN